MSRRKFAHSALSVAAAAACLVGSICYSYATSCTCKDICDIDNAANEARAAQWEYQTQILLLKNADQDSLFPTWFTPWGYSDIQKSVQKRINEFTAKCSTPINHIRADTNGGDCSITVQPTSDCMKEFAMAHEYIHQGVCQSFSHDLTYQMSMSMEEMLQEEIRGYQTAIDKSRALKQGALSNCCCENTCTPTENGSPVAMLRQIVKNLLK